MKNLWAAVVIGLSGAGVFLWWALTPAGEQTAGEQPPNVQHEEAKSALTPPTPGGPSASDPVAPADLSLSGTWRHTDTVIALACEGNPRTEKQVQGETFKLAPGAESGKLQYADNDCSFTLNDEGGSARIGSEQRCSSRGPELVYEQLEVTREGDNSVRLASHGTMTVQQKTGPLKCSFDAKGTAVRANGS